MTSEELTQSELKRVLHYDQFTGIFTLLVLVNNTMKVGDIAGSYQTNSSGKKYHVIKMSGKKYKAHRLAALYMTGLFPLEDTDHIDGNGLNNIWVNLRSVSRSENAKNRRLNSNNKSGYTGVTWNKSIDKWHAEIQINRKKKNLGYFIDINDAIAARNKANIKYGFHENHGQLRPL